MLFGANVKKLKVVKALQFGDSWFQSSDELVFCLIDYKNPIFKLNYLKRKILRWQPKPHQLEKFEGWISCFPSIDYLWLIVKHIYKNN